MVATSHGCRGAWPAARTALSSGHDSESRTPQGDRRCGNRRQRCSTAASMALLRQSRVVAHNAVRRDPACAHGRRTRERRILACMRLSNIAAFRIAHRTPQRGTCRTLRTASLAGQDPDVHADSAGHRARAPRAVDRTHRWCRYSGPRRLQPVGQSPGGCQSVRGAFILARGSDIRGGFVRWLRRTRAPHRAVPAPRRPLRPSRQVAPARAPRA